MTDQTTLSDEQYARIETGFSGRLDAALFGEAGARAVVSVDTEQAERLAELVLKNGLSATRIGTVGGDRFEISRIGLPLSEVASAWTSALSSLLDG